MPTSQSLTGYTQANNNTQPGDQVTGRTQFMPEIAVDQATGTVVLSWRDASDDAAQAATGSPPTSPPVSTAARPSARRPTPTPRRPPLTPSRARPTCWARMADNQGPGNGQRDPPSGYGNQMGLAVFDGQVYPIWAGNLNQAFLKNAWSPAFR